MATEKWLIDANVFADHLECMARTTYPNLLPGLLEAAEYARDFLPTVDAVEVVHGQWIEKQEPIPWCEDDVEVYTVCSVCDSYSPGESNYCPNCGAKMDGGMKTNEH